MIESIALILLGFLAGAIFGYVAGKSDTVKNFVASVMSYLSYENLVWLAGIFAFIANSAIAQLFATKGAISRTISKWLLVIAGDRKKYELEFEEQKKDSEKPQS